MKPILVYDAAMAVNGKLVNESKSYITGATQDSREVKPGDLYVAIKGERVDGHKFIADCFEKGAAAVLCEYVPEGVTGTCIVVENTVKALQNLAEWFRLSLNVKVVGITGSVGKTSTKEIVASVLSAKFKTLKTIGNYNNEIGLPLTILRLSEDDEIAVLEMGISDFGEMDLLSHVAHPDVCVITNIGQCHLENLGTRDGILKAKTEIFNYMNPNARIYLNGDDDKLVTVKDVKGIKPVTFGLTAACDVYPLNVKSLGLKGSSMHICGHGMDFDAVIHIPGNHMVSNAMAAAAIGHDFGMTDAEIIEGLGCAETISGRLNMIPRGDGFIIDDCYNAAPKSMMASIDTLTMALGRKVAILGDMFELGTDSDAMHAEVGVHAAKAGIDKLVCVGSNSIHMYNAAKANGTLGDIGYYETLEDLIDNLKNVVNPSDNILVKASHGMGFSKLIEALKNV